MDALPEGEGWQYEPKYDGFRCIAHRGGGRAQLQSRTQKPLGRYFPELEAALEAVAEEGFVLDGEIVIPGHEFDTLQLRLHPAESRVRKLSEEVPAELVAFDLLARRGAALTGDPLAVRRAALEEFVASVQGGPLRLGEVTTSLEVARGWLGRPGLDGIVAKRRDLPYQPGSRAMRKFKLWKSADCVIGGLYRKAGSGALQYLLLGLYDADGRLNYVGRAGVGSDAAEVAEIVAPLLGGEGFTGRAPGGKSRWSGKERKPVPLRPELVAEVSYDHVTGDHMRHGARFLRWRPDKAPESCTMDQLR